MFCAIVFKYNSVLFSKLQLPYIPTKNEKAVAYNEVADKWDIELGFKINTQNLLNPMRADENL